MYTKGPIALTAAALIATATALAHTSCIFLGPACYKAQMAPPVIVQSALEGSLVAPLATTFIASLFILCALYALSGASYIKPLPLLKLGLATISGLCLVRGFCTLPLSLLYPEMISSYGLLAGMVWFFCGILFGYGYLYVRSKTAQPSKSTPQNG